MKWEDFVSSNRHNPNVLILDEEHLFKFIYGNAARYEDKGWPHIHDDDLDLVLIGGLMNHRTHDGKTCGGHVVFAKPLSPSGYEARQNIWQVHRLDPLTITPSVQCHCSSTANRNNHGFITNGKWVPV